MTSRAFPRQVLGTLFRIISKTLLSLFLVCLVLVVLWIAANRLLDESPDPPRDILLTKPADQLADEQNVAVGILGLTAPPGDDFVQYGSRVKALYDSGAPFGQIEEMLIGPKTLALTVNSDQVECWLDPDYPGYANFKDCLPFTEAPKVLEANSELLGRFKYLFRMEGYSGQGYIGSMPVFVLLKLSVAQIHLALRQRKYEAAYLAWRDQLSFVRRNLRGRDTWVGKAIELVAFGMSFGLLESLLRADPQLALRHRDELLSLLQPDGMNAFNPEGIVRAEYELFYNTVVRRYERPVQGALDRLQWLTFHLGQRNRILNSYYAFAHDYAQMLRLPWNQVEAEAEHLREKHVFASGLDIVLDPFGSMFLAVHFQGQLKTTELLRAMHVADGRLRLATLLVRLMNSRVEDRLIPDFLAAAGSALSDPFSGHPMKWSEKERRIYFPNPDNKCAMYASVYLPPLHSNGAVVPSTSQSRPC